MRFISLGEPNYGKALRRGILEARGTWVICEEIDLCDLDFHSRALEHLRMGDADMVVGSKAMKGSDDQRPLMRRAATLVLNGMLRIAVDFRGTDTHGLKAFHRETLVPVVEACVIDRDLFASELVIRAGRSATGGKDVRCTVSIGGFVPKPHTPFRSRSPRSARPRSTWPSACRPS